MGGREGERGGGGGGGGGGRTEYVCAWWRSMFLHVAQHINPKRPIAESRAV